MKRKRLFGWHFASSTLRDGSPLPQIGHWERYSGPLKMCVSGLHVGITPWDALQYAPGDTLRLVEYAKVGEQQADKIVCARRRTIVQMDATEMLRYFARLRAISCIDRWQQEPSYEVIEYLFGNDELRSAAESAARSAAYSAADSAAYSAACSTACSAACSAACLAACSTARSAALSTACSAACSAAYSAACSELNALVYECFEGPMRDVGFQP